MTSLSLLSRAYMCQAIIICLVLFMHMIPWAFVLDRKSTRLNSSHPSISYAVFCLKKKNFRVLLPGFHLREDFRDFTWLSHDDGLCARILSQKPPAHSPSLEWDRAPVMRIGLSIIT